MPWSSKAEKCVNCGTIRRPHRARGLCGRCYGLTRKLEQIEGWNAADPETLKLYPLLDPHPDATQVEQLKASYANQVREQLDRLRHRQQKLAGPISGLDLELMLEEVARYARGPRYGLYNGLATVLQSQLDEDQRQFVYELLFRIVDHQALPALSLKRAFDEARE